MAEKGEDVLAQSSTSLLPRPSTRTVTIALSSPFRSHSRHGSQETSVLKVRPSAHSSSGLVRTRTCAKEGRNIEAHTSSSLPLSLPLFVPPLSLADNASFNFKRNAPSNAAILLLTRPPRSPLSNHATSQEPPTHLVRLPPLKPPSPRSLSHSHQPTSSRPRLLPSLPPYLAR